MFKYYAYSLISILVTAFLGCVSIPPLVNGKAALGNPSGYPAIIRSVIVDHPVLFGPHLTLLWCGLTIWLFIITFIVTYAAIYRTFTLMRS